ncbi:MAG: hypothetical protein J1E34_09295 [Oscillospiraceae bacterium]|nr:hypothetical protein [Oscillospiraceae bacterium]
MPYIQTLRRMCSALFGYRDLNAEEASDYAFCEKLYEDYLPDPDPEKTHGVSLNERKKAWGIN